jgi:DNA-binding NarL/FixJ family response regulator
MAIIEMPFRPAHQVSDVSMNDRPGDCLPGGAVCGLVVAPDPKMRQLVRRALRQAGCPVALWREAVDVPQAARLCRSQDFELVVLDSDELSSDVLSWVSEVAGPPEALRRTVLLISDETSPDQIEQWMETGFCGVLSRSVPGSVLEEELSAWFSGRRADQRRRRR